METWLITGGAGFIGSNFIRHLLAGEKIKILNLDKLTYAGKIENLQEVETNPNHIFIKGDICDSKLIDEILTKYRPKVLINFAAESHVDRSILNPSDFFKTNIEGTFVLLENAKKYWEKLSSSQQEEFRFLQVSTDEVYGSLGTQDPPSTENSTYKPRSPYSASKASSDHLVLSYYFTYGLPTLITNCSNNYGPYQFPEKLIPLTILNALEGKPIPLYGDGLNIRDWIFVKDHCRAIEAVIKKGEVGKKYNVGGNNQKTNLDIVETICSLLDEEIPNSPHGPYKSLITYIKDRPGHDRRYDINSKEIERISQWKPLETFETGIKKTVTWYLRNLPWVNSIKTDKYNEWFEVNYSQRLKQNV